ncbi:MAG: hypothetical protein E4G90_00315 [Gemmatimonadales bacterium]|nr:MAG: hypothetical protein E4G90_00315 [Gemmatimonadales bacterium]
MTPGRRTFWGILAAAGGLAIWDIVLLLDDKPGNTISAVLAEQSWAAGGIGYIIGHLFTRSREDIPMWASGAGGVLAVVGGNEIGIPLVSLFVGFAAGLCFWPNQGKGGA